MVFGLSRGTAGSALTFQIQSDLHLEAGNQYTQFDIPCCAPNLILAGDIGRLIEYDSYLDFIRRQCIQFLRVILILGNHEYYSVSRDEGLRLARRLEAEPSLGGKLHVLQQGRLDIGECTILGCTLNSHIPLEAREVVQAKVQDFSRIKGWTIDDHNEAFESDRTWLQKQLSALKEDYGATGQRRKVVVVTHHAPLIEGTSRPEQTHNAISSAFATDVIDNGPTSSAEIWIFGHTHFTNDFMWQKTRVISNQRGYVMPSVSKEPGWTERVLRSFRAGSNHRAAFDVRRVVQV